MKFKKQPASLIILSIILVTVLVVGKQADAESNPYDLVIRGLVDHPFNFTYNELQRFPMVSEVALLRCIDGREWLYNWTGIPLFSLLSITGVKAGATEVVFYASDGFSSSLTIERALHPTTLLALQANGTVLSHSNGYPYRLVVPCKYGYKWVQWITEIEVVDYDYKGTLERVGFSDEADIPHCTLPSTTPPYETFHIVRFGTKGNTTHSIITLSNSTINSFDFDPLGKQICFNVTGPPNTKCYFCVTIPKELLWCDNPEQWQVWVNNTLTEDRKVIETTKNAYIYFTYNHSTKEIQIKGVHVISIVPNDYPTIQQAINAASSGDTVYVRAGEYYENVVLNKTVLLIGENKDTTTIDGNGTGTVVYVASDNVTVSGFTIQNGGTTWLGSNVWLNHSHHSIINKNIIRNNFWYGIYLYDSNFVTIDENMVTNNENEGVWIVSSSNCTVKENTLVRNNIGVGLYSTQGNIIYHNNFLNNTQQVYQYGYENNTWDNGCEGNYWSNYNGTDIDLDGIGDTLLPHEGVDRYPLMSPYIEGDVDHDGRVRIKDIVIVALAYNSKPGDPNWNPHGDMDQNGEIKIKDIVMVALHFGETWDWDKLESRRFY